MPLNPVFYGPGDCGRRAMSYTVDVWNHAFPAEPAQAWAVRDELLELRDAEQSPQAPSSEMSELHRRLTTRYACICDDENGPWSDGPLINNFGPGRAILGISFSRVEEVLPFVIATATSMGLHVFDGQDEAIHRPVGFIADTAREEPKPHKRRWWKIWQ